MYGRHLSLRNLRIPRNSVGDSGVMSATFTLARPETMRSSTPAARFSKEPPFARLCGHQAEFHSAWFGRLQRLQEGERSRRVRAPFPAGGLAGA
jgi:hypothetical protein